MIFAIPRDGKTYVGTTDTVYNGDIAHPRMTFEDRDYVLKAIKYMFPDVNVTEDDIESSWAGLRPLIHEEGKSPSEISRKDEIFVSDSGLISIAGGKLTGYRKMAESIVDLVSKQLTDEEGLSFGSSKTKHLPISGGDVNGSEGFVKFIDEKVKEGTKLGLTEEDAKTLVQRYGSNIDKIYSYYSEHKQEETNLDPVVYACLKYAIDYEMVHHPVDFFVRRTAAYFFNMNWVTEHKDSVVEYMAKQFNWTDEKKRSYTDELDRLIYEATHPVEED